MVKNSAEGHLGSLWVPRAAAPESLPTVGARRAAPALTSTSMYMERSVIPRLYKVRILLRERAGLFFMYLLPSHIESRYMTVREKVGR